MFSGFGVFPEARLSFLDIGLALRGPKVNGWLQTAEGNDPVCRIVDRELTS